MREMMRHRGSPGKIWMAIREYQVRLSIWDRLNIREIGQGKKTKHGKNKTVEPYVHEQEYT